MDYRTFIENTLKEAAKIALQYFGKVSPITKPEDNNQVLTEADIAIGEFIVSKIQEAYPTHNIIDEEAGAIDKGSEFTWVVDPIEATSNFANGSEQYGIMIGLLKDATPIAGGTILPAYGTICLAEKGKGSTKNGQKIHVTSQTDLSELLISYGIDSNRDEPQKTRDEMQSVAELVLNIRNLRNSGCEAIDGMYVAEGVYGGRINRTSKIWDNVAPHIIVEEAGGLWTQIDGSPMDYSNPLKRIKENFMNVSASPSVHQRLVQLANNTSTSAELTK